ncbi:hypothetical protein MTR67_012167 [Solanum verrucosum]|uniref:Uncharacterized protein n=1 Tax=Solanum verrucosum TaxID=315347 RepID=A0AAF0Q9B5_SOLVR|nr:hypothetical protein MTR67_012167 [Solanum verrucosum]
MKFIQEKLLTAQSRQKEYADRKVGDLEFMEGEQVLLKVSPMKGVMHFGKRGKLSLRYIGPFEVLKHVGEVAYELALPPGLSEEPVAILDREVRKLRSKEIASIKVQWKNRSVEESTWESEADMHERYPHFLSIQGKEIICKRKKKEKSGEKHIPAAPLPGKNNTQQVYHRLQLALSSSQSPAHQISRKGYDERDHKKGYDELESSHKKGYDEPLKAV